MLISPPGLRPSSLGIQSTGLDPDVFGSFLLLSSPRAPIYLRYSLDVKKVGLSGKPSSDVDLYQSDWDRRKSSGRHKEFHEGLLSVNLGENKVFSYNRDKGTLVFGLQVSVDKRWRRLQGLRRGPRQKVPKRDRGLTEEEVRDDFHSCVHTGRTREEEGRRI